MSMTVAVKPNLSSTHLRDRSVQLRRLLEKLNVTLTQAKTASTGTALDDQAFSPMGMQQARQQCRGGGTAGSGITIGIMSTSFNNLGGYQSDVMRGYLPGTGNPFALFNQVIVLQDLPANGTDEGRAMAQLVHAFVPYAQLCFAAAATMTNMAANIISLATPGGPCNADVLVDDIIYFESLYFEDDMLSQAVDLVSGTGKLYFSAAGNYQGQFYEEDLNPVPSNDPRIPIQFLQATDLIWWHAFNVPGAPSIFFLPVTITSAQDIIYLQWNDRSGFVNIDLDLYIFDQNGRFYGRTSGRNIVNRMPLDAGVITPGLYYIAVGAYNTSPNLPLPTPYKLVVYMRYSSFAARYATERSMLGQSCANGALAVAAFSYLNLLALDPYSSHGPCTIYYGQRGAFVPPQIRLKPDVAGIDCTDTSFFGGNDLDANGLPNFCGTSAAAPHVAGVGAYLQQLTNKRLTTASMRSIFANTSGNSMMWNAASGYGLVKAAAAASATGSC
mmetsp:Transcript_14344/g.23694  ORF Transcript_14344/g.23694 Transcript_14344/m.23694 type:complete len:499 (-) Transcript_14344:32-1528(-)